MSGPVRHRSRWQRLGARALPAFVVLAAGVAIAAALQVRDVRVSGTHRFPVREVETALRAALGTPTIATRAGALRARVLEIPWVADASVQVSLDGVVSCAVTEREPDAVAVDGGVRRLVDSAGTILGAAADGTSLLELDGFGPFPEERAAVLAAVPACERAWGARVVSAQRIALNDVAFRFAGTPLPVLADPRRPDALREARRVLTAWTAKRPEPARIDARVAGLVAVLPAPEEPPAEPEEGR